MFRLAAATIFVVVLSASQSCFAEPPTMEDIEDAWRFRQERLRSATFKWTETHFVRARSIPRSPRPGKLTDFVPEEDLTVTRSAELFVHGGMMRYAYQGQIVDTVIGTAQKTSYISTFDGKVAKNFFDSTSYTESKLYPLTGFVRKEPLHYDHNLYLNSPLIMNIRPCDATMGGIDIAGYSLCPGTGQVGGRLCYIIEPIETAPSEPPWEHKAFWVDPERDFIVCRIVAGGKGRRPTYSIDIEYRPSNEFGWIPLDWTYTRSRRSEDVVNEKVTGHVTVYELNPALDAAQFDIRFPLNTAVTDQREGERFVTRPAGGKRRVLPDEIRRGITYDELIATEEGEAGQHRDILDAIAAQDAGLLLIEYLKTHGNEWPSSWTEVLGSVNPLEARGQQLTGADGNGGFVYGRLVSRVAIDWDTDPESIRNSDAKAMKPFVTRSDGWDFPTVFKDGDPNEMVRKYLQGTMAE